MKKVFRGLTITLSVSALLLLTACTNAGTDSGGGGADFDPGLYYTKVEVNDMLAGSSAFVGGAGTGNWVQLTAANSYSTTHTASVPVEGALIYVSADNSGGASPQPIDVRFGSEVVLQMTVSAGETVSLNAVVYVWSSATSWTITDSESSGIVSVKLLRWLDVM